jgi:ABC-type antimicrobial peptide transport system ATPase subunit
MSISGDQEIARAGDQKDKIYVCRMTIPVTTIMYSDRIITNLDGSMAKPVINIEMLDGSELPDPN